MNASPHSMIPGLQPKEGSRRFVEPAARFSYWASLVKPKEDS